MYYLNVGKQGFRFYPRVRCFSRNVDAPQKEKYALNVPTTSFELRIASTKRTDLETGVQEACDFDSLYSWQREALRAKPLFVVHDAPPPANGAPNIGHFVDKVLKDIIIRFKLLTGHRIHYVPGFDCHLASIGPTVIKDANYKKFDPLEVRKLVRDFALTSIKTQMEAFKRWGVMADWENSYNTLDKDYEITQFKAFFELYKKGLVFRDLKPVYLSPSTRSTLTEAEVEYKPRQLTCAYVKFPLKTLPAILQPYAGNHPIFALIWTTQPWTLPMNECILYNEDIEYSLVEDVESGVMYVVASDLVSTLDQILSLRLDTLISFSGKFLENATYMGKQRQEEIRMLPATTVTARKGTGLVHSGPSHGFVDFDVCTKYNLPVKDYLDDNGCFTNKCNEERLVGKSVLEDADQMALDLYNEYVVKVEKSLHAYPHDSRNKPVIIKPSWQWFLDTDKLKDSALASLKKIEVFPSNMQTGMIDQLKNFFSSFPISQRKAWGLPIPAFYEQESKRVVLNSDLIDHWCKLVDKHGSDMWWLLSDASLLPKEILKQNKLSLEAVYEKGQDILNIRFDSGISWKHLLTGTNYEADVCLEEVNQSSNWFQPYLLTSAAFQDKPSFKKLIYHGFVLDKHNRKKLTKALESVDPQIVVNGQNVMSKVRGADTLRWWVACHVVDRCNGPFIPKIIEECTNAVQKLRGALRFMLRNLGDFDSSKDFVSLDDMELIDQYILHLLYEYQEKAVNSYESFRFDDVCTETKKFICDDISEFYLELCRDRLYCGEPKGIKRRSCQTALHHLFVHATYSIAPILPHLAEEAFFHHHEYGNKKKLIFRNVWPDCLEIWKNPKIKSIVAPAIQLDALLKKEISALDLHVAEVDLTIEGNQSVADALRILHPEPQSSNSSLCELLKVASVTLSTQISETKNKNPVISTVDTSLKLNDDQLQYCRLKLRKSDMLKCHRCKRYVVTDPSSELCSSCLQIVGKL